MFQKIKTKEFIKSAPINQLVLIQSFDQVDDIGKAMVALANSRGGCLIIGVKKNKNVSGIDPADFHPMIEKLEGRISPSVDWQATLVEDNYRLLYVMDIERTELLHSYKSEDQSWNKYVMFKGEVIQTNEVISEILFMEKKKIDVSLDQTQIARDILDAFTAGEEYSFTQLTSKVKYSRNELVLNLAKLIYLGEITLSKSKDNFVYELKASF